MKVKYTSGGSSAIQVNELVLENVGANRFRVSIPVQDGAGKVISRTAEIEAASERTKAGTVRIMLKCTIPYFSQMIDDEGHTVIDSVKSSKPYTLHIVHTIPATMANDALNNAFARQVAQVVALASQIVNLGTLCGAMVTTSEDVRVAAVPLDTGDPSVDGVASYPLSDSQRTGSGDVGTVLNISAAALSGSFIGRALAGLMPIDINNDKTLAVKVGWDSSGT